MQKTKWTWLNSSEICCNHKYPQKSQHWSVLVEGTPAEKVRYQEGETGRNKTSAKWSQPTQRSIALLHSIHGGSKKRETTQHAAGVFQDGARTPASGRWIQGIQRVFASVQGPHHIFRGRTPARGSRLQPCDHVRKVLVKKLLIPPTFG